MFAYKSDRQVSYVPKHEEAGFRHHNENPLVVGIGLKVHQATRSKTEVNILHKFGYSINYERVLRIETQLAHAVLKRAAQNNGLYIPETLVKGRFLFFAIDNVDFAEDTPDGKGTLHATATAVFQFHDTNETNTQNAIAIEQPCTERSLSSLAPTEPQLLPCSINSQHKPTSNIKFAEFTLNQNEGVL